MNQNAQAIANSINTWAAWHKFYEKVRASKTYKHAWFVWSEQANDGEEFKYNIIGDGLTEEQAQRLYDDNKFAVEYGCGYDYANIYMANLYDPEEANVVVYERLKGNALTARARELQELYGAILSKLD